MASKPQCDHYQRHVSLFAPCCQQWFNCHRCHNQEANHELVRSEVTLIKCRECSTEQPVSDKCINLECVCAERFDLSYCRLCLIWSNNPDLPIYHCDDCGICRIGPKETVWHCQTCQTCISVSLKDSHLCQPNKIHCNCPICQENLFHSQIPVVHPKNCTHAICVKCYSDYLQSGQYQCPVCRKSLFDMTAQWYAIDRIMLRHRMPTEFSHYKVDLTCNDCSHHSHGMRYHFQFHKCLYCPSYNTSILKTYQETLTLPTRLQRSSSAPLPIQPHHITNVEYDLPSPQTPN
jgi:RING finger/CHY zinc finger protein 1